MPLETSASGDFKGPCTGCFKFLVNLKRLHLSSEWTKFKKKTYLVSHLFPNAAQCFCLNRLLLLATNLYKIFTVNWDIYGLQKSQVIWNTLYVDEKIAIWKCSIIFLLLVLHESLARFTWRQGDTNCYCIINIMKHSPEAQLELESPWLRFSFQ